MDRKLQKSTSRESDKFIVRLPDGMRDKIASAANLNGRSMNAEIVARLQESFSPPEPVTVHINLVAGEETKMKDILAAMELLKSGIRADQGIEVAIIPVLKW